MTRHGAHIRSAEGVSDSIAECIKDLKEFTEKTKIASINELPDVFINRDILITQFVYLNAIASFIKKGSTSRGSYLVLSDDGILPVNKLGDEFRYLPDNKALLNQVCEIELSNEEGVYKCTTEWKPVRPIPEEDNWFENVWNEFRRGSFIKGS